MNLLLILMTSLFTCAGQLCQKQAVRQSQYKLFLCWLIGSMALLACGMMMWLLVLQRMPVGLAYPMLSINFIFVALGARFIWHEKMTVQQCLGMFLIILGVALIGRYA